MIEKVKTVAMKRALLIPIIASTLLCVSCSNKDTYVGKTFHLVLNAGENSKMITVYDINQTTPFTELPGIQKDSYSSISGALTFYDSYILSTYIYADTEGEGKLLLSSNKDNYLAIDSNITIDNSGNEPNSIVLKNYVSIVVNPDMAIVKKTSGAAEIYVTEKYASENNIRVLKMS